jgi:DDB1- and CUL4-associated factor 13
MLQHSVANHIPARRGDPTPTSRNLNPHMHPFAAARERMRALNAIKMERMFAKPFVAALEGHIEGIERIVKQPKSLHTVASAGWDGGMFFVL